MKIQNVQNKMLLILIDKIFKNNLHLYCFVNNSDE